MGIALRLRQNGGLLLLDQRFIVTQATGKVTAMGSRTDAGNQGRWLQGFRWNTYQVAVSASVMGGLFWAVPIGAQAVAPVVLREVTVIDVQTGRRMPARTVVIAGTRIQALGPTNRIRVPAGARVVDARGKYLIPGLWDFHRHPSSDITFPLLIATGVTGFRDASSLVPLDTLRQWRREILAGARVGPPRQIFSGVAIDDRSSACKVVTNAAHVCVPHGDTAAMLHLIDSLQAAGVDMLKLYELGKGSWFFFAREARRRGLRFGGHPLSALNDIDSSLMAAVLNGSSDTARLVEVRENDIRTAKSEIEMADSGASIIDHIWGARACWRPDGFEVCRDVAQRFRRTGLWVVPTAVAMVSDWGGANAKAISGRYRSWTLQAAYTGQFPAWLRDSLRPTWSPADSSGPSSVAQRAGVPVLAGTDTRDFPMSYPITGFASHVELAMAVADGMTPLHALQTATLNPAKFLHATDSLGTVAVGKLADLVLLDADPLADITNTLRIRAVVANGRYYDRAMVDQFLAEYLTKRKQGFWAWRLNRATNSAQRGLITIDSTAMVEH